MDYTVTLIPGDGIGPEVTEAAIKVLDASGVPLRWERVTAGADAVAARGTPLPEEVLASIRRNRVALKGPITTPVGTGFSSVNVALRKALDLYVSFRPVRTLRGVQSRHQDVDVIIVRENTEGLYAGREHSVVPGVVEALRIVTRRASERIARWAFEMARREGRRRVTLVHKASIMRLSDGLFLDSCRRVAQDYPFIECDDLSIDNTAMQLVLAPERFDVLVMENLFGDLMSDLCAGLVGGLGVVPGANIGDRCAVFEAVHGSAPGIAGRGIANPTALILSGVLMLRHLGQHRAADAIARAVERVLAEGRVVTPDLGGTAGTMEMASEIAGHIQDQPERAGSSCQKMAPA